MTTHDTNEPSPEPSAQTDQPEPTPRRWWWRWDEWQCPACGGGQGTWERSRTYDESEKGRHSHIDYDDCVER